MSIVTSPPAVILINLDLTQNIQDVFRRQLYLTDIITKSTFDGYIAINPSYVNQVHINQERIMVMSSLFDHSNRDQFDIVLFAKAGMVSILVNKVGPVGITLPIDRVSLLALITLNSPPPLSKEVPDLDDGFIGENDDDDFDPNDIDPRSPSNVEPVKLG